MDEYYVEYHFQAKDSENEYLFPVFILGKTRRDVIVLSHKVQLELNQEFIMISVTPPKLNHNKLTNDYYKELYGTHVNRNKIVDLNVITYAFKDFDPDISLTFNENLEDAISTKYVDTEVAEKIHSLKLPVRVLKDQTKGLNQHEDYLVIRIGV